MYLYADLEAIARSGGYQGARNGVFRITPSDVQNLQAGLARSSRADVQALSTAVAQLRRWIVHGDNRPPPVRGAGFVRSDGEVWMAYTEHPSPAIVRGRVSHFEDLRMFLPVTLRPDYDGSLGVRTKPHINLRFGGTLVLESKLGGVAIGAADASNLERWLSATLRRGDRLGVLCLPGAWQSGAPQVQDASQSGRSVASTGQSGVIQPAPPSVPRDAPPSVRARN